MATSFQSSGISPDWKGDKEPDKRDIKTDKEIIDMLNKVEIVLNQILEFIKET